MAIEKIESIEDNIDVFENDIDLYINLFCEENNIDDIKNVSQSVFNGIMIYVYRKCFKNTDRLKVKDNIYKVGNSGTSTCNSYNIPLISDLVDYYIFLCRKYDKEISFTGFGYLTGISLETFYSWRDERGNMASSENSNIYKKLFKGREESLSDKLVTGRQNPVGVLGVLNHYYNWAGVGNMEERKPQQVSLSDVRSQARLLSDNSGEKPLQIASGDS